MDALEELFIHGPVVIFKWRNERHWPIEFVSGNAKALTGYTIEEICCEAFCYSDLIHPDDLRRVCTEVEEHSANGAPQLSHRPYRIITKSGRIRWVNDYTLIKRNSDGTIQCYIGYLIDITESWLTAEALKTEKRRLSNVLAGTNVGIWEWNIASGEVFFNERWAEIVGYSLTELAPFSIDTWTRLAHPEDLEKSNRLIAQHFAGQSAHYECEVRMRHRLGHWVWVLDKGKVSQWSDDGSPLLMSGTHQEITERKRLERELHKKQNLDSLGTLAGGIAHDFNNILMVIFGNIALAKMELPAESEGHTLLSEAERAMSRATHLTQQLLIFAKGGDPVKENVSLEELVQDTVQFDLSGSSVLPVFHVAPTLWLASVDKGQMQQVVSNLTINAKQAMPSGGHLYVTLENATLVADTIPSLNPGRYLKLTIRDEGSGIAPQHLERIFEPYFSTKQTGNGLGLATVYSIVRKHQGHISLTSTLGVGTQFVIYLPASAESTPTPVFTPQANNGWVQRSAKILVMDDDADIRKLVATMLTGAGYGVETVSDGREAIDRYRDALKADAPFAAVIMDLTVPGGLGGKETISDILAIDPNARCIVSSGYADDPIIAHHRHYGFKGIAVKPYTQEKLQGVLERVLIETAAV